jgi:hypothetical protein
MLLMITLILIIIIMFIASLVRCYKFPCFLLCLRVFLSFTRAHCVICPWTFN